MRKTKPKKRILLPDPKFHDSSVTRFVNNLMYQGKKSIAYRIFYDALDIVSAALKMMTKETSNAPVKLTEEAPLRVKKKPQRSGYSRNGERSRNFPSKNRNYSGGKGERTGHSKNKQYNKKKATS